MTLRDQLTALAEPGYRAFVQPLMPGAEHVLGVRIPHLRRIARALAQDDWHKFLAQAEGLYFEEQLLQGLVIGYAPCPIEEKLPYVARFIPRIDNWALCDSFCWELRSGEREPMWQFIQPYFRAPEEFAVRFAVVMALKNFIDDDHFNPLLELLDAIRSEHYYTRMAVAWALSVCFVRFPDPTYDFLRRATLDRWTFQKTLQKIGASRRVSAVDKTRVRALQRKENCITSTH